MKLFIVFVLLIGGMLAVVYPFQIVRMFGHVRYFEEHLGPGGSYGAWRLIGVLLIVASFLTIRFF